MDDLWGDEPDWFGEGDENGGDENGGGGDSAAAITTTVTTTAVDEKTGETKTVTRLLSDDYGNEQANAGHHIVVLLDCRPPMFTLSRQIRDPNFPDGDDCLSPADWVLMACETLIRRRIRHTAMFKTGKRNGFGMFLFNTKYRPRRCSETADKKDDEADKKTGDNDKKKKEADEDDDDEDDDDDDEDENVENHEFLPLEPSGVTTVQTLRQAQEDAITGIRELDLEQEYASTIPETDPDGSVKDGDKGIKISLQEALVDAKTAFKEAKCVRKPKPGQTAIDLKEVWIFTCDDNPQRFMAGDDDEVKANKVTKQIHDMKAEGVELYVWPLSTTFRHDRFYEQIMSPDELCPALDFFHMKDPAARDDRLFSLENFIEEALRNADKIPRRAFGPLPFLMPDWKSRAVSTTTADKVNKEAVSGAAAATTTTDNDGNDADGNNGAAATTTATTGNGSNTAPSASPSHNLSNIMVDFYRLTNTAARQPLVKIHQETGRALEKVLQSYLVHDHDIVPRDQVKSRIREYQEFGADNEKVFFPKKDVTALKQAACANGEFASLILLGFKPRDRIPYYHTVERPYFIYPNEDLVEGSAEAFANLHASMIRKGVVAMGELLMRRTATSRLVAILPIEEESERWEEEVEEVDEETGKATKRTVIDEAMKRPPGMLVVALPYEDEVRYAPEPDAAARAIKESAKAPSSAVKQEDGVDLDDSDDELTPAAIKEKIFSKDIVAAASKMIDKLTLGSVEIGKDFPNAQMRRYWDYVEQVALEDAAPTTGDSSETLIDEAEILKLAGDEIEAFKATLPEDIKKTGKKRKAKKNPDADDTGIDWQTVLEDGGLSQCKVAELQKFLVSRGAVKSGKKSDLVDRVEGLLNEEIAKASRQSTQQ